jgi:hypothetical protein
MPDARGDTPSAQKDLHGEPALTAEAVLLELDFLATVEHALCVEYLLIHAATAASPAAALAQDEMRHLHGVNRALGAAGRPPQVGRATSITGESMSEIALVPPSPAHLEGFLKRAREIAAAVDRRYARLRPAVAPEATLFEGDALEQMSFVLDPGPDHATPIDSLDENLGGLKPESFRAAARDPADDVERTLLRLSDRYYGLIVSTLEAWFAYESELSGILRGRALSLMDGLDEINGALVGRGLLPRFAR